MTSKGIAIVFNVICWIAACLKKKKIISVIRSVTGGEKKKLKFLKHSVTDMSRQVFIRTIEGMFVI